MIIERIIILDYENKVANEFKFSKGPNIITSDGTTVGKSSLTKSLYYALGFEIKQFPHGWDVRTMRFRIDVLINDYSYSIIRHNSLFYVSDNVGVLNLKEFSEWLQEKLSLTMKLKLRGASTKELSSVYATELLAPFYLDQDKSWNGYIFKNSSDSLGRYSNIPRDLLEYVLGISNEKILEKENEKSMKQKLIKVKESKISILNTLQEEYADKTEMLDSTPFNTEELESVFNSNLNRLSNITDELSAKKNAIFKNKSEIDLFYRDNVELKKVMAFNKNRYKEVALECVHCHSKLTLEQSLTRLKLNNNLFEIQYLFDENSKEIEKLQMKIENQQEEIIELNKSYNIIVRQKKEIQEVLNLQKYIDLESKRLANEEFIKTIYELNMDKDKLESIVEEINREIRLLKKKQQERKSKIRNRYFEILSDINLHFGSTKLSELEFFDFREVKGSGMDNNKTLLALYLTYMRLVSEFGVYILPFGIDSFVKNEIDKETVKVTFKEVERYFLSIPSQTFFVTISENLEYLTDLENYHVIMLNKPILKKVNYSKLFNLVDNINITL